MPTVVKNFEKSLQKKLNNGDSLDKFMSKNQIQPSKSPIIIDNDRANYHINPKNELLSSFLDDQVLLQSIQFLHHL